LHDFGQIGTVIPMSSWAESEDEPIARERARYLERTTQLDRKQSLTLAIKELGYSHHGVAAAIDSTKGTVASRLDTIEDIYGTDAVMPKCYGDPRYGYEDERGDLTPLSQQPSKGPIEVKKPRRRVVLNDGTGTTPGPHAVEQYYRTWTNNGRICRDGKIALSLAAYDEQIVARLQSLEWNQHHCTYDPDYQFVAHTESRGAWTFDNDAETRAKIGDTGIYIPDDNLPVVAHTVPRREDTDPFVCPNESCDAHEAHADKDLQAYPRLSGPGVEIVAESDVVTHICLNCRTLIIPVAVGVVDENENGNGEDGHEHENDNIITEVMQP
jgi:hypothetical protein